MSNAVVVPVRQCNDKAVTPHYKIDFPTSALSSIKECGEYVRRRKDVRCIRIVARHLRRCDERMMALRGEPKRKLDIRHRYPAEQERSSDERSKKRSHERGVCLSIGVLGLGHNEATNYHNLLRD